MKGQGEKVVLRPVNSQRSPHDQGSDIVGDERALSDRVDARLGGLWMIDQGGAVSCSKQLIVLFHLQGGSHPNKTEAVGWES